MHFDIKDAGAFLRMFWDYDLRLEVDLDFAVWETGVENGGGFLGAVS